MKTSRPIVTLDDREKDGSPGDLPKSLGAQPFPSNPVPPQQTVLCTARAVLGCTQMSAAEAHRERAEEAGRHRHFSMIRDFTLADFITLANAGCGAGSILAVQNHMVTGDRSYLWLGFGLLPFALLFDYMDGRVARWRRKASPLGAHLDSLADVISFGVAPAVLAFAVGMRGALDVAVLLYFVGCGVSRLARFNATCAELADAEGKVKYFEGTPIPTSLLLVAVLAVLVSYGRVLDHLPLGVVHVAGLQFHPLVVMYAISGSAMISKTLRIPKF